jgi:DSF synthase
MLAHSEISNTKFRNIDAKNHVFAEFIRTLSVSTPQISLEYEEDTSLLWITLRPEPKPIFTLGLIESVHRVQSSLSQFGSMDSGPLYLAYRTSGPFFSMGGDLDYYLDCLAKNDRSGLRRYARLAADVVWNNMSGINGRIVTLATVAGKALGGGIDPARACNVMIAEEAATFCYPEVNYNHFPITATPVLCRRVPALVAQQILTSARRTRPRNLQGSTCSTPSSPLGPEKIGSAPIRRATPHVSAPWRDCSVH